MNALWQCLVRQFVNQSVDVASFACAVVPRVYLSGLKVRGFCVKSENGLTIRTSEEKTGVVSQDRFDRAGCDYGEQNDHY